MALTQNNFIGFESGGLEEASAVANAPIVQSSVVRTGGQALHFDHVSSDGYTFDAFENASDAGDKYILGFAYRVDDTTPAANDVILQGFDNSDFSHFTLRHETDGDLVLRNAGGTIVGTATTPFTVNTWHFIEMYWENVQSGVAEVFIGGEQVIDVSGQDFLAVSSGLAAYAFEGQSGSSHNSYIDDVYCLSGATAASDRLGDCEVFGYRHRKTGVTPDAGGGGEC